VSQALISVLLLLSRAPIAVDTLTRLKSKSLEIWWILTVEYLDHGRCSGFLLLRCDGNEDATLSSAKSRCMRLDGTAPRHLHAWPGIELHCSLPPAVLGGASGTRAPMNKLCIMQAILRHGAASRLLGNRQRCANNPQNEWFVDGLQCQQKDIGRRASLKPKRSLVSVLTIFSSKFSFRC
jgi:hypothetical protein